MLPFFHEPTLPAQPATIFGLSEDTARHAGQVLRMRVGEQLQLTNGQGLLAKAELISIGKKQASVRVLEVEQQQKTEYGLHIAIGLLKNAGRLEWMLEKLTELGIAEIVLLQTQFTEKTHPKPERWQQILVSAMIQSQQVWLPKFIIGTEAMELLKSWATFPQKLFAHCAEDSGKQSLGKLPLSPAPTALFIGPEGDFSPAEITGAQTLGYQTVALGNTRLRTETAAITATALVLNKWS